MAKIKLTKNELKKQKDSLKMFTRYLPTLQLKKQQLQVEIKRIELEREKKAIEKDLIKRDIESWVSLFGENFPFEEWVLIKEIKQGFSNIAGVTIPVFSSIEFYDIQYSLLKTPYWVDRGVEILKAIIKASVELKVLEKQIRLLEKEFQITSQRVNLFEKVMIPQTKSNIKKINIYLGDQQTAAVVRGKIAKNNLLKGL